jgi:hypothetical protein
VTSRADYNPDQPRAENGQFGEGGGTAGEDPDLAIGPSGGPRYSAMTLPAFAAEVRAKAQAPGTKGLGPKAFISSAFITMGMQRGTLAQFKARLLEAHKAGLIELQRADMPAGMPAHLVETSETEHPTGARYHFIRRDTSARPILLAHLRRLRPGERRDAAEGTRALAVALLSAVGVDLRAAAASRSDAYLVGAALEAASRA